MQKIATYLAALSTSVVIAWGIGAVSLSSPTLLETDAQLNLAVPIENSTTHFRAEGRSNTTYGKHGFTKLDTAKLDSDKPKILIWGDSYVEAHQVQPDMRMQYHAQHTARERVDVVSVGYSGRSVADYYFLMPSYQGIVKNIVCNVIFLGSHSDILPGQSSLFSKLEIGEAGKPVWIAAKPRNSTSEMEVRINSLHPYFLRTLTRKVKAVERPKFYRSKKALKSGSKDEDDVFDRMSFWGAMLQDMKKKSNAPLLFVYAPHIPSLKNNQVVTRDSHEKLMADFANASRAEGVGFKNLGMEFVALYESEKMLVRGFPNSRPGRGHLNQHGHRIAGQSIADCVAEVAK